jgi:hypothetical protein
MKTARKNDNNNKKKKKVEKKKQFKRGRPCFQVSVVQVGKLY